MGQERRRLKRLERGKAKRVERRKYERMEWDQLGTISSLLGKAISNCWVKNIAPSGARLIVTMSEIVPDYFRLNYGADKVEPKCRVRWREGNELGVEFYRKH